VESAEEIALYGGEETEKYIIERDYFGLVKHINRVLRMRIWHGIVEEGIIKYVVLPISEVSILLKHEAKMDVGKFWAGDLRDTSILQSPGNHCK
jgi:ABC-type uncharacterized transport system fused permease/ATPase subunit